MSEPLRWKQKLRWVALAFVPSSLMLGATTALTSEVPALPLFWVLPLALYLISFIFVFARHKLIPQSLVVKVLPALLLVGLLPETFKFRLPLVSLMTVYLSTLFCVALFCHGELALSRPRVDRLTEFYLLISLGGVLGGIFNALLAPLIFHSATEFPLVIVFASLLRPSQDNASNPMLARRDWLYPLLLGSVMTAFILLAQRLHYVAGWLIATLFFSYSALACFSFHRRRLRFSLGVITFLAAASLYSGPYGNIAETARNFFGVVHVSIDPTGHYRELLHEGTVHGLQSLDPLRSRQPLAYYTRTGPVGQVFNMLQKRLPNARIAVVGLGAGSMACLTHQGEPLTYYEIDPLVVRFARDQHYFTYLEQCAPEAKIILGDARLEMRKAEDASYDLIALDAFSGDSVPVHLLTQDALRLYLQKLAPGGVLAFHISSIYLDIEPILGDLARDTGLVSRIQVDMAVPGQVEPGHYPSVWLVMARTDHDLSGLTDVPHSQWKTVRTNDQPVWTDDYSNLLSIIRWH